MNLSELQAFLEESNWDDEPEPAHPADGTRTAQPVQAPTPARPNYVLEDEDKIPTLQVEPELQDHALHAPVKLVPKAKEDPTLSEPELRVTDSVSERLKEIEMAQKMGYLLCKCTWPPQIMVLTGTDHVYRCRRCSRVREL